MGLIFGILAKFEYGRKLLLNHPKFFSFGIVSHEGPSDEAMKNSRFSITFYGKGWSKEDAPTDETNENGELPTKKLVTRVSASNPGLKI